MKKIEYVNPVSKKKLSFELAKNLTVIYGKNGTGKTSISRSDCFSNDFVFNSNFISKNIFVISEEGASLTTQTKESFSGLWISEDIVKLRTKMNDLNLTLKELENDKNILYQKVKNDYSNNSLGELDIDDKDVKTYLDEKNYDKNLFVNLNSENIKEIKKQYKTKTKISTLIKNDDDLSESAKKIKNNLLVKMFFNDLQKSSFLRCLVLQEDDCFLKNLQESLSSLNEKKDDISNIELFFKNKNQLSFDFRKNIKEWIEKNKNIDECFFCFREGIEDAKNKWNNFFNNKYIELKDKVISDIKNELSQIKHINKEEYSLLFSDTIENIKSIERLLHNLIKSIEKNNFEFPEFKKVKIKKGAFDEINMVANVKNYIINKYIKEIEFYSFSIKFIYDELNHAKKQLDFFMNERGSKIANEINRILNFFNLDKEIKIEIDNKSKIKKFTYKINNQNSLKTLSDGEKQKIALAFFFYYVLEKTTEDSDNLIVLDDPIVSMDFQSYINLKNFISKEIVKNRQKMPLLILTHNFHYLYAQISNLIDETQNSNNDRKCDLKIYKIERSDIKQYDNKFFKMSDFQLFTSALNKLTTKDELIQLCRMTIRIYRSLENFLKSSLSEFQIHDSSNFKEFKNICYKTRTKINEDNMLGDDEIIKIMTYLNSMFEKYLNNKFITDENFRKIKDVLKENKKGIISTESHLIKTILDYIYSDVGNKALKAHIDHPDFSYFKSLFSFSLDVNTEDYKD